MGIKRKPEKHVHFHSSDENSNSIDTKVEELIHLLQNASLETEKANAYVRRLTDAFDKAKVDQTISSFQEIGDDETLSREELLDRMGKLLSEHEIDSSMVKTRSGWTLRRMMQCIIAVVAIVLGLAMIIMPAPPSFEIYTVFYFSQNDGVTIMDLVSLLIVLCGVFLFITTVSNKNKRS